MKIEWKDTTKNYSAGGKDAFLGKWCVAEIEWDGVHKVDEKWIVYLRLPGLKQKLTTQYKHIGDAMKRAEKAVEFWIAESGIKVKK